MKPGDVLHHWRRGRLKGPLPWGRLSHSSESSPRCGHGGGDHRKTQYPAAFLTLRHLHAAIAPALITPVVPPGGKTCIFHSRVRAFDLSLKLERVEFPASQTI